MFEARVLPRSLEAELEPMEMDAEMGAGCPERGPHSRALLAGQAGVAFPFEV